MVGREEGERIGCAEFHFAHQRGAHTRFAGDIAVVMKSVGFTHRILIRPDTSKAVQVLAVGVVEEMFFRAM